MKAPLKGIIIYAFIAAAPVRLLQAQSTMKGTVVNSGGQALSNVSVLLLHSKDSALVKGMVSDRAGAYLFSNVAGGKYLLSFSFTGYKQVYSSPYFITGSQDNILTGETQLIKEDLELNKVTVTGKKPLFEQKIDRLVINVRNSITAVGATALDVLERSPGVIVDRQNNALSMGGKEGVLVMINGKESHLPVSAIVQMLAGMNSATIEKIELITTPPSNFSAEGNAGIINIVLVDNNGLGTNGSFAITGGIGKSRVSAASFNFNHRKGRLNLFGDYSFRIDRQEQAVSTYRKIDFGGKITETSTTNDRDARIRNFTGRMGMDLQVTKRTSIGAVVSGYINKWTMDAINETSIVTDGQLDTLIHVRNHENNNWKSIGANLNAQHVFRKGGRVTLNLDYLYYHDVNRIFI
ncbi:MAG TPA: TonB-dependent receptor [Chryseolinea sp.]|nr:TonB-dependent receptor [Chryseolinea sp.]